MTISCSFKIALEIIIIRNLEHISLFFGSFHPLFFLPYLCILIRPNFFDLSSFAE